MRGARPCLFVGGPVHGEIKEVSDTESTYVVRKLSVQGRLYDSEHDEEELEIEDTRYFRTPVWKGWGEPDEAFIEEYLLQNQERVDEEFKFAMLRALFKYQGEKAVNEKFVWPT